MKKLFILFSGFCHAIYAGTMGPVEPPYAYVGTLSIGPVWISGAENNQTLFLTNDIEKTYTKNNSNSALADGELFLGIQYPFHTLQSQTGLAVATTSKVKIAGEIWDDADPTFNNFSYNYRVRHTHLAIKEKLLMDRGYMVIPWISGSLGVAWNRASDFYNTPLIFEAIPTPNFTNHTKTAFTYTLGVGVQKTLTPNWQAGIGYEFADWGEHNLGRAMGQTVGHGLWANHLYTNGALVNLTYIS